MNNALKFAKEMIRKEKAAKITQSQHLRKDYLKSVKTDRRDLAYYCMCKGLSVDEVMKQAIEGA